MDYIIAKLIEYIDTLTPLPLWKYYCYFFVRDVLYRSGTLLSDPKKANESETKSK